MSLNLIQGVALDALANPSLDVNVVLDDPEIGEAVVEAETPVSVTVVEGVVTDETVVLRINAFGDTVAAMMAGQIGRLIWSIIRQPAQMKTTSN